MDAEKQVTDEQLISTLKEFSNKISENSINYSDSLLKLFDGDKEAVKNFINDFNKNFWDMLM